MRALRLARHVHVKSTSSPQPTVPSSSAAVIPSSLPPQPPSGRIWSLPGTFLTFAHTPNGHLTKGSIRAAGRASKRAASLSLPFLCSLKTPHPLFLALSALGACLQGPACPLKGASAGPLWEGVGHSLVFACEQDAALTPARSCRQPSKTLQSVCQEIRVLTLVGWREGRA